MGVRSESLVNDSVILGFRHIYLGALTDADQIINIVVTDVNGAQKAVIPGGSIIRTGLGSYEAVLPGGILTDPGTYYDTWNVIPVPLGNNTYYQFPINVVTVLTASQSSVRQALECSLSDLDACMLKTFYLWPVWSVLANGYYIPDYILQRKIDISITKMERLLNMPLERRRVLTRPFAEYQTPVNPVLGVDYEEEGRLLDWSFNESLSGWVNLKLPHSNILRVTGMRGIYGGRAVYRIPQEWINRNELTMGYVRVRPTTAGSIRTLVDGSGKFLDETLLEAIGQNSVPGFWAVDYEYGPKNSRFALELCDWIMKKAAVEVLSEIGQQITRGLSGRSASVDGLSTSLSFVASAERGIFGALEATYQQDLQETDTQDMRRKYKGMSIVIL